MSLRVTSTNSGDDSSGKIWGIEGNNLFILLGALIFGVALALVLKKNGYPISISVAAGLALLALAAGYVFWLRQGRPAAYDRDLLELLLSGKGWEQDRKKQPHIPLQNKGAKS